MDLIDWSTHAEAVRLRLYCQAFLIAYRLSVRRTSIGNREGPRGARKSAERRLQPGMSVCSDVSPSLSRRSHRYRYAFAYVG